MRHQQLQRGEYECHVVVGKQYVQPFLGWQVLFKWNFGSEHRQGNCLMCFDVLQLKFVVLDSQYPSLQSRRPIPNWFIKQWQNRHMNSFQLNFDSHNKQFEVVQTGDQAEKFPFYLGVTLLYLCERPRRKHSWLVPNIGAVLSPSQCLMHQSHHIELRMARQD